MNRVHRLLLGATGGRIGWRASGMPVIELTTTGRRSGRPRATMLTSPYQEGSTIVIVALAWRRWRQPHPAWYLNLRDNPVVSVSVGGKTATADASRDSRSRGSQEVVATDHCRSPQLCRLSAQDRTRDTRGTAPPGGEGLIFLAELPPSHLSPERLKAC